MPEINRYLNSAAGGNNYAAGGGGGNNNPAPPYKSLKINANNNNSYSRSSSTNSSPRFPRDSPRGAVSAGAGATSPRPPPTSGPGSGKGIDVHPFSRGGVIEVLYVKRKKVHKEKAFESESLDGVEEGFGLQQHREKSYANIWDDDESLSDWFNSDDDDQVEDASGKANRKTTNVNVKKSKESNNANVYLADIIDRLPLCPQLENTHPKQQVNASSPFINLISLTLPQRVFIMVRPLTQ